MTVKDNQLILHSLATRHLPLTMDLAIVRDLGFDGLETSASKIKAFLDAGFSKEELRQRISNVDIPGIGFLIDIERQGDDKRALMREAEEIFQLASAVGAKAVEVITGPLDVSVLTQPREAVRGLYRGLIDLPAETQISLTSANLAELADMAAAHGLLLYLEALSWTPLNSIDRQLKVLEKTNRDNVRILIDFWHCYTSGETPERVSRLDKNLLYGVHICDSLEFPGGVPNENVLRDVATGSGVLNLKEWVDAVKATGYAGWWSCELFSKRQHQENGYDVALGLKTLMRELIEA